MSVIPHPRHADADCSYCTPTVFYKSNTHMLLGDAKAMCEQLKHQVADKYGTKA